MNKFYYQLKGPFQKETDVLSSIKQENSEFGYVYQIGISAKPTTIIILNEESFEIGKTGILEFYNVKIFTIKFKENTSSDIFLDLIIKNNDDIQGESL